MISHPESSLSNQDISRQFSAHAKTFQDREHPHYDHKDAPLRHRVHEDILDYVANPETRPIIEIGPEGKGKLAGHLHSEIKQLSYGLEDAVTKVDNVLRAPEWARTELNEAYAHSPDALRGLNPRGSKELTMPELQAFIKLQIDSTQDHADQDERREHLSWQTVKEIVGQWTREPENRNPDNLHRQISRHLTERRRYTETMRQEAVSKLSEIALSGSRVSKPNASGWELPKFAPRPTPRPRTAESEEDFSVTKMQSFSRDSQAEKSQEVNDKLDPRLERVAEAAKHNTWIYTSLPVGEDINTPTGTERSINGMNEIGDGEAPRNIENSLAHLMGPIVADRPDAGQIQLVNEHMSPQALAAAGREVYCFLPAEAGYTYFDYSYNPVRTPTIHDKRFAHYLDVPSGRIGNLMMLRVRLPNSEIDSPEGLGLRAALNEDPLKVRSLVKKLVKERGGVSEELWQGADPDLHPVSPPYGKDATVPHEIVPTDVKGQWELR